MSQNNLDADVRAFEAQMETLLKMMQEAAAYSEAVVQVTLEASTVQQKLVADVVNAHVPAPIEGSSE